MLTGQFNANITIIYGVPFNDNVSPAVYINTVGGLASFIGRIFQGGDIENGIAKANAIIRLVETSRTNSFKANKVYAYIIIIVDQVIGNNKLGNIAIQHQGFTGSQLAIIYFISIYKYFS